MSPFNASAERLDYDDAFMTLLEVLEVGGVAEHVTTAATAALSLRTISARAVLVERMITMSCCGRHGQRCDRRRVVGAAAGSRG